MEKQGKHYKVASCGEINGGGRIVLHDQLALTGAEVSINNLPAGASVPFVHAHKRNEEIYVVLNGQGQFYIDGDEFDVQAGSVIRIDPAGARCIKAGNNGPLRFICVQTEANSLMQFTENDGLPVDVKPSWFE